MENPKKKLIMEEINSLNSEIRKNEEEIIKLKNKQKKLMRKISIRKNNIEFLEGKMATLKLEKENIKRSAEESFIIQKMLETNNSCRVVLDREESITNKIYHNWNEKVIMIDLDGEVSKSIKDNDNVIKINLEDKIKFNPFHYIYFKNDNGNIFLHKDITDIVEELLETEDTRIKKFFRNIAFYLYYLCIDKDLEITVPMIYEFIEKMSDDIVHEFKIMAGLIKNDNDIFITHFNYDKDKNIIPFQNLDMIEAYPEIKKGIDPYLRNELEDLIEYGNDNLINIKKELLKNWEILKSNKFSQILSCEELKIEEKLKEKEISKVFLIIDDKDIERYSFLLRLLILTLTKNNYDMFSNKRTLFVLNEHKKIGKQIFFRNEFSYLEKENIKTIAILKRKTLEKYPEKDFSDNFATELLVNNDELKYKYKNKYDLPYELILRKGK